MAEPTTETTEKTTQCADGACVLPQQAPTPEDELWTARMAAYEDQARALTALTVPDLRAKLAANESLTVVFSRKSCPWCQVLMPNLVLAQAATGKTVYYVDTLNTLSDPVLKAFRDEYEISFVPTLLAFRAGQVGAKYDGDRSIADVQLFLQNN